MCYRMSAHIISLPRRRLGSTLECQPSMVQLISNAPFLDRVYDEAMALLIETRNYIAYQERRDADALAPDIRLIISQETLRMTSRLTQSMAWLLAQKAVQAGEIGARDALVQEAAVDGEAVCLDDTYTDDVRLPDAVRNLLARTRSLYVRVHRLDQMMRDAA